MDAIKEQLDRIEAKLDLMMARGGMIESRSDLKRMADMTEEQQDALSRETARRLRNKYKGRRR